jgi:transcriptional regulator with XRE-family HTH domain
MSNDFGHAIVVRRAILKMTQADLARRIGVTRNYISMIETGERPMTDELVQKISAALGCKPEELSRWPQAA